MFDLIIKNGKLIDGSGRAPADLDIGIKGSVISAIGNLKTASASKIINAAGKWVTPGFIDIQNHSDSYWSIFDYPRQESMLLQGITTIAMGHCGASLAPLPSLEALKSVQKWHSLAGVNFNWRYFEEFLDELKRQSLGVNILSLVGHSTIRRGLLGDVVRNLTTQDLKVLERIIVSSFKSGAFGLSIGLVYAHEYQTAYSELIACARLVNKFNRLLSVHLRSEGEQILESLDEIIKLAADSGANTKISHLKIRNQKNWHLFESVIEKLERAYQRGIKINFDVYPYTTSWSVLYTYLPKWATDGGREELIKRIRQPYLRNKLVDNLREQLQDLSNITIATASSSPHLVGRTLGHIAADQGTSIEEALINIISATESEVIVFEENIASEQMLQLLQHPLSVIATDGAGFDVDMGKASANLVHPRCFGTMPRFLQLNTNKKLLSEEKAIQKITSQPAKLLGLYDRGELKVNNKADVVIIDPERLADLASIQNPFQPPQGINWVIVNGNITTEAGALVSEGHGSVLYSKQT